MKTIFSHMMLNLFSPCFNKFTYTYHTKQVCECYVVYFITKPSTLFTITDINIHVLAKNKHLYIKSSSDICIMCCIHVIIRFTGTVIIY